MAAGEHRASLSLLYGNQPRVPSNGIATTVLRKQKRGVKMAIDFNEQIEMLNAKINAKENFLVEIEEEQKELQKLKDLRDYLVELKKFQGEQDADTK